MATPTIDRVFIANILADLVRINSINPELVPGEKGEAEICAYLADLMKSIGLEVNTHEAEPGRTSVAAWLRGRGGGKSLMLYAHVDTVGVEGMEEPFSPAIREGRMYGRGTYDMKGSLAACVGAIKALADTGFSLGGDVLLAAPADEEYASIGIVDLLDRYRVDGAIVTEPTDLELCLAHKGFVVMEVVTRGRAAHGSLFSEGIDANMHMARFLNEVNVLEKTLQRDKVHPLVGPPSIHAPLIAGGTEVFTYAARCELHLERRTIPGETEKQVMEEMQAIIDRLAAEDPNFQCTLRTVISRSPYEVARDTQIVRDLEGAVGEVLGREGKITGQTYWMDTALIAERGIETVVIGPKGRGLHSHEEWVDLDSVADLAEILVKTAMVYCE
jgi:acetylornithine deacetylase